MSLKSMKPGRGHDVTEEIAEVHSSARSPSPKPRNKTRSRSKSSSRRLSNGHPGEGDAPQPASTNEEPAEKFKTRDSWIKSDQNESLDIELPIHDQIKQGILGFVEKEIKKTDGTGAKPSFVFYSHDPNDLDEKFLKTLSRPSSGHSGHKEKRSPSFRKKKRHSSRARERDLQEFDLPGSSLSALEKVDDYLKEYNKEEVVTLSGELEIEPNDVENNNGNSKELRHKPRKTKRKVRDDRQEANSNGNDISPKVFKVAGRNKGSSKPARPSDLTAMLESLEASRTFNEHAQYMDNPFSSPSPLTSPNDERLNPFSARRPEKVYLQGGGTFRAVSRDRILGDPQLSKDSDNFMSGSSPWSPLLISLAAHRAWRRAARALPGLLAGAALLHLLALAVCDAAAPAQRALLAAVTAPYAAGYYVLAVLCLVAVLDRLDPPSMDLSRGLQPYVPALALAALYGACVLASQAARHHDELLTTHAATSQPAGNNTQPFIPEFYATWMHLSVWRSVLAVLADVYLVLSSPPDLLLASLSALTQYQHHLQPRG